MAVDLLVWLRRANTVLLSSSTTPWRSRSHYVMDCDRRGGISVFSLYRTIFWIMRITWYHLHLVTFRHSSSADHPAQHPLVHSSGKLISEIATKLQVIN